MGMRVVRTQTAVLYIRYEGVKRRQSSPRVQSDVNHVGKSIGIARLTEMFRGRNFSIVQAKIPKGLICI